VNDLLTQRAVLHPSCAKVLLVACCPPVALESIKLSSRTQPSSVLYRLTSSTTQPQCQRCLVHSLCRQARQHHEGARHNCRWHEAAPLHRRAMEDAWVRLDLASVQYLLPLTCTCSALIRLARGCVVSGQASQPAPCTSRTQTIHRFCGRQQIVDKPLQTRETV
jgi:hypothetical protein